MDSIRPIGEPPTGQMSKLRHDIKTVRFDLQTPFCPPTVNAFHENAARTTDVQESPASM